MTATNPSAPLSTSISAPTSNTTTTARSVLITGCSTGIGLVTAQQLQACGFHVIASVRNPDDIPKLTTLGIECIHLDLTQTISIDAAVDYIEEHHPQLYGLVNNGAYGQPGAVEDLSTAALREQFETNFFGTHELTRSLLPLFRRNGIGRIIQISSVLGFVGLPMRGAYNASKFALEGLSDTLRVELLSTNIKIAIIQPGPIESDFRPNAYKAFAKHIDANNSVHKAVYAQVYDRLHRKENARFTLPAAAVADCVEHALNSRKPKVRYRVTLPTKVMAVLKRLISNHYLDKFIAKQGH